ncbi:type III pantothenate kinase [Sesbania bispinosa]|nr:type III pantothenate kinase [Sesbania bispinosa]
MAHSVFGRGESLGNVRVGKAVTGDIVIGGFITPLAHALNIDLSHDKQVLGQPSRSHEDLEEDAPGPSSFSAGPFGGPLSQLSDFIAGIEVAQEQQRLQFQAFIDEQREQLQNIELRQKRLQDMIQAHHQGDTEYRAMLQAMYHWHISQGHCPPPQ